MSRRFAIVLQALILLVVGGVMIWFYSQGRIGAYLTSSGSFQAQVLLAGVVLGVVALFLIMTSGKEDVCNHDHDDHDHGTCGHNHADHGHENGDCDHAHHDHAHSDEGAHHHHEETLGGMAVTGLVILVPLLAAAVFTPDAYSSNWVQKNSAGWSKGVVGEVPEVFDLRKAAKEDRPPAEDRSGEGDKPQDTSDTVQGWGPYTLEDFEQQVDHETDEQGKYYLLDVISVFYTGGDEEVQAVVDGLRIETVGQVMPETMRNPDGSRLRVFRLMMNCCIADARPVSIPVDFGRALPDYKEMGWYKFKGTLAYEKWDDFTIPVLRATSMEVTESPEQGTMGQR